MMIQLFNDRNYERSEMSRIRFAALDFRIETSGTVNYFSERRCFEFIDNLLAFTSTITVVMVQMFKLSVSLPAYSVFLRF